MLRKLDLTNFKAWQKLRLPFGKITGLFGANSSGKSRDVPPPQPNRPTSPAAAATYVVPAQHIPNVRSYTCLHTDDR